MNDFQLKTRVLGKGSFGIVFEGTITKNNTNKSVAVKLIDMEMASVNDVIKEIMPLLLFKN